MGERPQVHRMIFSSFDSSPNRSEMSENPDAFDLDNGSEFLIRTWLGQAPAYCQRNSPVTATASENLNEQSIFGTQPETVKLSFRHERCSSEVQSIKDCLLCELLEPTITGQPNLLRQSQAPLKSRLALALVSIFTKIATTSWCESWRHGTIILPECWERDSIESRTSLNMMRPESLEFAHRFPMEQATHVESLSTALTWLCVTLEEVCFATSMGEQRFFDTQAMCNLENEWVIFGAARQWLNDVQLTMGTSYYRATAECIALSMHAGQLAEEELWQQFYDKVIMPLHKLWSNLEAVSLISSD
ncbi:MAG: hypothetical protein Q9159_002386 [Coniocarpon cinnabarinum]